MSKAFPNSFPSALFFWHYIKLNLCWREDTAMMWLTEQLWEGKHITTTTRTVFMSSKLIHMCLCKACKAKKLALLSATTAILPMHQENCCKLHSRWLLHNWKWTAWEMWLPPGSLISFAFWMSYLPQYFTGHWSVELPISVHCGHLQSYQYFMDWAVHTFLLQLPASAYFPFHLELIMIQSMSSCLAAQWYHTMVP